MTMRGYRFEVDAEPSLVDLALLEERLADAAIAAAGAGDEKEFAIFVRDVHQRVVAGISAAIWGGCCQFHTLWVGDSLRGRGLGRALLIEAEAEARRRGCRLVMGLTYDVLTAGFFEPFGYQTVGVIEDCPSGTTTRWIRKELAPTSSALPPRRECFRSTDQLADRDPYGAAN